MAFHMFALCEQQDIKHHVLTALNRMHIACTFVHLCHFFILLLHLMSSYLRRCRFRCISTSYFRKADGVILLYDCCSERSFVNVREWVETIRQASQMEHLPIMMCGNKIDIRGEKEELGYNVSTIIRYF